MCRNDWDKIRNEYVTGSIATRPLAAKYDISYATLRDRAQREKWAAQRLEFRSKLRVKTEQKIEQQIEAVAENAAEQAVHRNQLHIESWDLLAQRARELLDKNKKQVGTLGGVIDVDLSPSDIEHLSKALNHAQRGHRLALGLDRPDAGEQDEALEKLVIAMEAAARAASI